MSIEEKRRAAFERWALKNLYSIKRDGVVVDYANHRTDALWCAWNAALDSAVIELPKDIDPSEVEGLDDRPLMNAAAVQAAIESAGLKVKP